MTAMDTEEIQVTELDVDIDTALVCQAYRIVVTEELCEQLASWRVALTCSCRTRDYLLCGEHKDWTLKHYKRLRCWDCHGPVKITRVIPI